MESPWGIENAWEMTVNDWLVVSTPLKNITVVSWDDDIPNIWKNRSHVPNHQPTTYAEEKSCLISVSF